MDAIAQNKRLNSIRTIYKIIEKLVSLYNKSKLTLPELKEKLQTLKTRIHNDFDNLDQVATTQANDDLNTLIGEYFLFHNYDEAYQLFAQKYKVFVSTSFYKDLNAIMNDIEAKDFKTLSNFIRENRLSLKNTTFVYKNQKLSFSDFEKIYKIFSFHDLCKNNKKKDAIMFIRQEFENSKEIVKNHLCYIINSNIELSDCYEVQNTRDLAEVFKSMYLSLFRQCSVSRLEKRLEYGVMCYKTKICGKEKNPNCPTCLGVLSDLIKVIPCSRKDNSIILCKGSGKEMNEKNLPYCFESGYVYCEEYIAKMNYQYECVVTGEVCKENPKKCYFV